MTEIKEGKWTLWIKENKRVANIKQNNFVYIRQKIKETTKILSEKQINFLIKEYFTLKQLRCWCLAPFCYEIKFFKQKKTVSFSNKLTN